jgi:hypothetical protein
MKTDKNEEQQRTINHIANNYTYGEIIPDSMLSNLLVYNISDEKQYYQYLAMMAKIRNKLIVSGIILRRIKNGYYVMKPSQISRYCYRRNVTKAHNIIKKGKYILENVDESDMSKDRIEELENMRYLSHELDAQMEQIIESSKYYSRKDYYDSLED